MAKFSLKIAEYLKNRGNIETLFLPGYSTDWEYYVKNNYKNILNLDKFFSRVPLKKISLDLYEKWNLDKDDILMNNFIRYKRVGSKTIHHNALQGKYFFKCKFLNELYDGNRKKKNYNKFRYNFIFNTIKLLIYPLKFISNKKTYNIIRPIHKILYHFSNFILFLFKLLPETYFTKKWTMKFADLKIIAKLNSTKDFSIVSKIVLKYFISYYLLLKNIKPEIVLIYNGNWAIDTPLAAACKKLDIPHYFTETASFIGYSHFDSIAVWYDGDINRTKLPEWNDKKEAKLKERIKNYLQKYKRGIASVAEDDNRVKNKKVDRKFIFVPLQKMEDTNNIKYSPLLENMVDFVKLIIENTPIDYDIIIKRHPWDSIFIDPLYNKNLSEIKKLVEKNDRVHLFHYVNSFYLLKHCSALVTINSTISMENILEARAPMVILGDNFVRGWDFTYDVNNLNEFPIKLKEALEKGVGPEMEKKMKQFLYLYFFDFIIKGHYSLNLPVNDENGKKINTILIPPKFRHIAERLYKEFIITKERKEKGLKKILPRPKEFRCLIDRSKIRNYKGVILDYSYN